MRALVLVPLLLALDARAACVQPRLQPVGPRSIVPQCSYLSGALAARGETVIGAWATAMTSGFTMPRTTGAASGGRLDARGRLTAAEQTAYSDSPGYPSLVTNGPVSLMAWSKNSAGTFFRFIDATGTRPGEVVQISTAGFWWQPPRAIWDGQNFSVVWNEAPDVMVVRLRADGTLLDRGVVARDAVVADALDSIVIVERSNGFAIVRLSGTNAVATYELNGVPKGASVAITREGDGYLVAWHGGAVGAQRLDAAGAPAGNRIPLDDDATDVRRVAAAGSTVLWNDGGSVRAARLEADRAVSTAVPEQPRFSFLLDAAQTSEGVLALVTTTCGSVSSIFLAHGARAFAPQEVVSRAGVGQSGETLVATARGHHAFWKEPSGGGWRSYVTAVVDGVARPPVRLGQGFETAAAPLGDGSAAAWIEYDYDRELPATLEVARLDAHGNPLAPPLTIASTFFFSELAVAVRGEDVHVYTVESDRGSYLFHLWSTRVRANGAVEREILVANVNGYELDATATTRGDVVVSWFDYDRLEGAFRLSVRDASGTRVFPLPPFINVIRLVAGAEPMVFWVRFEQDGWVLRALFPSSGLEIVVGRLERDWRIVEAAAGAGGSFDIAVATVVANETRVQLFHVAPAGVVTRREEVCFAGQATHLALRDGEVEALLTGAGGGLFVATHPLPSRRRAARS